MRLISLLVGLVIIALLISKQLSPGSSSNDKDTAMDKQGITLPRVPVAPKDVKNLKRI